jgi:hypothetical protein
MLPTHQIALPNSSIRSQLHSNDKANSGLIFRACWRNIRVSRIELDAQVLVVENEGARAGSAGGAREKQYPCGDRDVRENA